MKVSETANIFTIDQENHGLVWAADRSSSQELNVDKFLASLPTGGGLIVGDGNSWGVQNPWSVSQFGWETQEDLDDFLDYVRGEGYEAITIPNKLANTLIFRYGYTPASAVNALWCYVNDQVDTRGQFDSGHPVRPPHGDMDNSFGNRAVVVRDFLRFQNTGGYNSPFAEDVTQIAFDALSKEDRPLFDLKKTKPSVNSLRRIAAVAVSVYDPETGIVRAFHGEPWGVGFITRRIIGLNGMMIGKGPRAPGNPMRAALRCVGRRYGDKVNREERAHFDKLIRDLIRAFQDHGSVRSVTIPELTGG